VKLNKNALNLNYISEQEHEKGTLFFTAHKHTNTRTYVCVCVFIEKSCYPGNHIINVKMETKVA
jgi:hypothetical protein